MSTFFIKQLTWQGLETDQHDGLIHCGQNDFLGQGAPYLDGDSVMWRVFDGSFSPDDAARLGCVMENLEEFPDFEPEGTHAEIFALVSAFCGENGVTYNDPEGEYDNPWQTACANNTVRTDVMAGNGVPDGWTPYE